MSESNLLTSQSTNNEQVEGLDISESSGWGDYPLDSVFIRKEQRTVNEVIKRIEANRYILDPEFQRAFVWDLKKQSRLIESCLMRLPLPVFYVAEAKDGRIIVVDGLQRLTTFYRYLNDDFFLSKLGDGREDAPQENPLIGKKFSDLPLNLQERLEDTQLILYILDANAPERAKLDIFERVNGGVALTRQQMRNCLYSGEATKWLKKAAESASFVKATDRSLNQKTMRDREAINRFCAFKLLGVNEYKSDMDDFLARVLEKMNTCGKMGLDDLYDSFTRSMEINYKLFERHAFRKSLAALDQSAPRNPINISLFDVCSVLFTELEEKEVNNNSDNLRKELKKLLDDNCFNQSITSSTNSRNQVKTRYELMNNAIRKAIQQ